MRPINVSGLATSVAVGTSNITATSGTIVGSTTLTVTPVPLVSIAVTTTSGTPPPPVAPGGTLQLIATGSYGDGSTKDLTGSATWLSSNPSVATITAGGLATGVSPGTSTISAALSGITGTATLTVTNPVKSIKVTPANPPLPVGITLQFTATATFFDHTTGDITHDPPTSWTSFDPTVATVSSQAPTQGLARAIKAGATTIQASSGGVNGSTILTVNNGTLQSIAITPQSATISLRDQQAYTAMGTYINPAGVFDITNSATWSSATPTVATITTGGFATGIAPSSTTIGAALDGKTDSTLLTVAITPNPLTLALVATVSGSTASGVSKGTANIRATFTYASTTATGSTQLTVNSATLASIAVTPTTALLAPSTTLGFTATGTFSDGSTQNVNNLVTWSTSDASVVTVTTSGSATGQKAGSAVITATYGALPRAPQTSSWKQVHCKPLT